MEYNFSEIEKKWQAYWLENKVYKVDIDNTRPKYYVLDMFPYPSGAGLHVGHPLGYIASDIYSRYKRLKGFNVLHPMGYDAFGLPAEQYAIQTGQHPAITTDKNIARYREQLDKLGFSYDWSRELRTSDPGYYKWTQWAFVRMFHSYYCNTRQQARPIDELVKHFEKNGTAGQDIACSELLNFTAEQWNAMNEEEQQTTLLNYRLAYLADTMVNWCPALGTVLANDEVKDGLSERGGHPVEQRKMKQWSLRISTYAQRLLNDLENLDWSESLKEIQRNWIGRSQGAQMVFHIKDSELKFEIFTTRADTVFGVTFMVLAPESELVASLTTAEQQQSVSEYLETTKKRTERERMADRKVSGVFTGSYAINPFTEEAIPVWISDYVLSGYGTGAIMAVPAHDSRDYAFAKHFNLPIVPLIDGCDVSEESFDAKDGTMINSGFLNGLSVKEAIPRAIDEVEKRNIGQRKINYRLRDAIFSRQRYWGEPFPIYYKNGLPYTVAEEDLPIVLPEVDKFLPTETGEPPLGRAKDWTYNGFPLELSTMPGFAGSSAYYLRYMDPHNDKQLLSGESNLYWENVDLYIGGTEHATGHLVYSRFWNKFLYDIGESKVEEPFKKLVNQGMIQGRTSFVHRFNYFEEGADTPTNTNIFVSHQIAERLDRFSKNELIELFEANNIKSIDYKSIFTKDLARGTTRHRVNVNYVDNDVLDSDRAVKEWEYNLFSNAEFVKEGDKFYCDSAVEKMSKTYHNVVNPDDIVVKYGADTLRMYEMFLGPLEQSKPWDTKGIDGVHRFLRKFWRLYHNAEMEFSISDDTPSNAELKALHKTIKKVQSDVENFSFNTSVSAFMICVNELGELKCNKRQILSPLCILLSPFAPHIAEELWQLLGNAGSVTTAEFPHANESVLSENSFEYPISFNGKMRFKREFPLDMEPKEVEAAIIADPQTAKYLDGKTLKKVIVVKGKIVNVVF